MRAADVKFVGNSPTSVPYLPDTDEFDSLGADLFHDVIDKVWPDDGIIPWSSASEYRRIVEFLDAIPPQFQAELGRWFLQKRRELARGERKPSGVVRIDRKDRLVYGCSDRKYWG
jgi:hypothetical protein